MGTENIKKAIRQGLESSSLNESFMDKVKSLVGMETDFEKAGLVIESLYNFLKEGTYGDVEAFLMGKNLKEYPYNAILPWNRVLKRNFDLKSVEEVIKGTKFEKRFKIFLKQLNDAYRREVENADKELDRKNKYGEPDWAGIVLDKDETTGKLEAIDVELGDLITLELMKNQFDRYLDKKQKNKNEKTDEEIEAEVSISESELRNLKKIIREGFEIHKTDKECEYCGGTITHLEVRPEKNDYISVCDDCGAKESEVDSNVEEIQEGSESNEEDLLVKELIQKFYDINGIDTKRAEDIPTHKVVDGMELVKADDAYNDLGFWKVIWKDLLDFAAHEKELEEGMGRSHAVGRGKNKKPANYPWVKK